MFERAARLVLIVLAAISLPGCALVSSYRAARADDPLVAALFVVVALYAFDCARRHRPRRIAVLLLVVVNLAISGCSLVTPKADSFKVASSLNDYSHYRAEYEALCGPSAPRPVPGGCPRVAKQLNRFYDHLVGPEDPNAAGYEKKGGSARAALNRGGALRLQLAAIADDAKKLAKDRLWRSLP